MASALSIRRNATEAPLPPWAATARPASESVTVPDTWAKLFEPWPWLSPRLVVAEVKMSRLDREANPKIRLVVAEALATLWTEARSVRRNPEATPALRRP